VSGADADVIVVGAGPAGLAAATHTALDGWKTILIERMGPGGKLLNLEKIYFAPGLPKDTLGPDLASSLAEEALGAGVELAMDEVVGIQAGDPHTVVGQAGAYRAPVVIVATGSDVARLGVPGENEFEGRGISYCATCDGEFFRGQSVAVVGGGNPAAIEASFLADLAAGVLLVFREPTLQALRSLREEVAGKPNVRLLPGAQVVRIEGNEGGVGAIVVMRNGTTETHAVNGVFVQNRFAPNSACLGGAARLDGDGFVVTDQRMRTGTDGIYAVGDVRSGSPNLFAAAVGDAIVAATDACRYLRQRCA
jgi:thioredoxin reductase (NADPH)